MSAVLEGRGLTRRFGAVTAVDGVDIAVEPGEFFALLGPSGCGKTTLLRIFAGFETPDAGQVLVDGADITALKPNRRPLNMMFQSYALFPHMTVWRNVTYGLEMERLAESEIIRRAGETLEVTGLGTLKDRKPHELSGGQRQRVALARALVKRPKVLLLDEPLSALDRGLREQMQVELKRAQKDAGIAFVIVTHDQEEALGLADRIAVLDHGLIQQIGGPRAIYDRPANAFVARFVGENNLLPVAAAGANGRAVTSELLRAAMDGEDGPGETTHWLAIRPERIKVAASAAGLGDAALALTVLETVFHGSDLKLLLEHQSGRQLTARLGASAADGLSARPGDTVWCALDPEDARLLPKDGRA
jgi:ABC-type Fe3+/spermidine/putrescine transport system ATPase subunit